MNKVVLITGAARGVGRALTETFLARNWTVIATDSDDLQMAGLCENNLTRVFHMDVTSDESVTRVFEKLAKDKTVIDLIINNAGLDGYFPLSEAPVSQFRHMFEVNVFGGYRVNQVFLPLVRTPGGRIIHISSESLRLTLPFMPYPMTKRLVEAYAKALRIELKFRGVDVVIVRPGAINTRLLGTVSNIDVASGNWKLAGPFARFASTASGEIGRKLQPEKAAEFIWQVSQIAKPRAVYKINNMLQLKFAAMLPYGLMEKVILNRLK
ncbi:MAG: SDR family NAD(P)-dependent oxidoreductase [Bacteroidota bacterium]